MFQIYQNLGHIILMFLLLFCSAFFSGSETAFFNLSRRQLNLFGKSKHKVSRLVTNLLAKPSQLLGCILFGNMTVNILFYAVASVLTLRIREQSGVTEAALTGFVTFCLVILFGEILPKSLAYANSKSISLTTAVPLFLCVKILSPFQFVFRFFIIEPTLRLFLGPSRGVEPISMKEFKSLIEQVRKRGHISEDETRLIGEIIELGFLKVRNVMQPRVDMVACPVTESAEFMRELMLKNGLTKLPVYAERIDNIVGQVFLRDLLLHRESPPDKLVQKINYVPEQKKVESLLDFFRKSRTDSAVVVDEYGGIAGLVSVEHIAEELVGPIESTNGVEAVEQTGPAEYRLSGNLPIHDWSEALGIAAGESRVCTLGGMVTAVLGRIPKSGDVAYLNNIKFTVERMRKRRIETLILTFEPLEKNA